MPEKTESFTIKSWNRDDRPREKLRLKGRSALSDAELLAIILGSGSSGESAVSLAKRILASAGNNLSSLGNLSLTKLMTFHGVGEAKAISIAAALELGRRRGLTESPYRYRITNSASANRFLKPVLAELPHEEFWVLYLNNSNRVLKHEQLSKGGITGTLVDIRLALKLALELNATAMILAHNHPSGTLIPSEADKQLTRKFHKAAGSLDIKLLDHLIVTDKEYYSFADEGLL
ncbi:RadC family protein [Robertkochia sediminum]|uniref:RadC family protein n=1 Tax=Robertkochia sediminum TaxID=2785326 RepID=UPI001932AF3C|nr:DNA repair protein RadC [Robertkochia sediminum]MBL7472831.1 DNA repair protein RadC [Robertkochia sediminum]